MDNREGRGTLRYANGDVYEGEYKEGKKEGRGTMRYANGSVYEGEWKGGKNDVCGTYRCASGRVMVSFCKADKPVGEGVQWSADGQTAYRTRDGKTVEEISLEEARRVAEARGLPVPDPLPKAPARKGGDAASSSSSQPTDSSKQKVDSRYEGEYNAAGLREGFGTMRFADGESVRGTMEGR